MPPAGQPAPGENAYVTLQRPESVDPGRCLALYRSPSGGVPGGGPYRQCVRRTMETFCGRCEARVCLGAPEVHVAVPARLPGDSAVIRAWLVIRAAEAVRLGLQMNDVVMDAPAALDRGASAEPLPGAHGVGVGDEDEDEYDYYDDGPEILPPPRSSPGPRRSPGSRRSPGARRSSGARRQPEPLRPPRLSGSWFVDRYLNSLP